MSLTLLQSALLLPLEALLNGVLKMDAASGARLAALEGKTLAVQSTQPALALYVSIRNRQLRLSPLFEGGATATLRGPASGLLQLLLQAETPASLAPFGVDLQGSTGFMQDLQLLLRDLDFDWEFHLSRIIGDLPVAAMAKGMETGVAFTQQTLAAARTNLSEYLNYESDLFPERSTVKQFEAALLDLSQQLDRIEARIDLLQR
jgi:ubiquinone biosynthesis accessory factor UbiJ